MAPRTNYFRFLVKRDGFELYTRPGYWKEAQKTWHNYKLMGLHEIFEDSQEVKRAKNGH